MNKWQDYFKIVQIDNIAGRDASSPTKWMLEEYYHYELRDMDDNIIATYRDLKYAKKQARYKFRKLQAKLEKILLT